MRHSTLRLLCSLAVAGLLTTAVHAQPVPNQAVPAIRTVKLTMEDQHVLKENLLKGAQSEGSAETSADLERGKKVPASVTLHHFPDDIASKIPQIKSHEYFIANHSIVIVEPQARSIVEIVK
jgi:hypothetical protein